MSIYPGPTPPYTNPPIQPQNFKPSRFVIDNISLGPTTIITTIKNNNYVVGQLVKLLIPNIYGSYQINNSSSFVISILSPTQIVIDLDSSKNVNPFIANPTFATTKPQILAIGDINTGLISSTGRSLPTTAMPGSFQNISPQLG
jgi:hypothetical protein